MALRIVEAPIVTVIVDSGAASQEMERSGARRVPTKSEASTPASSLPKSSMNHEYRLENGEFPVFNPRAVAIYEGDGTGLP